MKFQLGYLHSFLSSQALPGAMKTMLIPRFGDVPLDELKGESLAKFDSELARDGLAPSTRRNFHIVFRSVLRRAQWPRCAW